MDSITGLLLTQYRGQIQAYRDGKDLLHPPDGWHHMLGEETVGGQEILFRSIIFLVIDPPYLAKAERSQHPQVFITLWQWRL